MRSENVNRRINHGWATDGFRHHVQVEYRNGHVAVDEYEGDICLRTLTVGTKREVADFLHAMMVGIDLSHA